ncbi:hypothetical protein LQV63_15325 [Paenibacillus profundus]|uniref:Uncharacterized protein n=1 Tax=Paenibacillus profundus TaxID=1173085 RepID=A0ABS8YHI1_9BACL|nr:hypothetical protein [Paenibacillus profundus]MCE5170684.1 hypothetical protein [Paenibacillus profundus]
MKNPFYTLLMNLELDRINQKEEWENESLEAFLESAYEYEYLHSRNRIDLIIGDREIDILPSKTMGIKTCLFQDNTPGADYYLSEYKDFLALRSTGWVKAQLLVS